MYKTIAAATLLTLLIASPTPAVANQVSQATVQTNAQQLFDRGLKSYQSQTYSDAAKSFSQASKAFANQRDKLNQALSLNYLSLTYQELGQLTEAEKAINNSVALLPSENGREQYLKVGAQALNTLGRLQLSQGKTEDAVKSWEQAIAIYTRLKDTSGKVGAQINLAQGFQALGLFRRAQRTLVNVKQDIDNEKDPVLKVTGLLSLANASRVIGNVELPSGEKTSPLGLLNQAEEIARDLPSKEMLAEVLLSKGNVIQGLREELESNTLETKKEKASEFYQQALDSYQQAVDASQKPSTQLQAQLNILRLLLEPPQTEQLSEAQISQARISQARISQARISQAQISQAQISQAQSLATQIQSSLETLPPSRNGIYARINFAQSLMKLAKKTNSANDVIPSQDACTSDHHVCIAARVVVTAIKQAEVLQDSRAKAYALGNLGNLYEQTEQWSEAEELSRKALDISQGIQAKDISSRWFVQLGRVKNARGKKQQAISAYEQAVSLFQDLQRDLVAMNRDVQFSFRNDVEPVYREYVRLLLEDFDTDKQPDSNILDEARKTIESLQLAQLENFFRSACLDVTPVALERIGQIVQDNEEGTGTASIIYPIVLKDRIAIIASLPNQSQEKSLKQSKENSQDLKLYTVDKISEDTDDKISEDIVDEKVDELRQKLVIRSTYEFLPAARDIYNWIIRPIEADLESIDPEDLVFVLDSKLQNIPIAALYDEEKNEYMIQKGYNLALSPNLTLLPPRSPLQKGNFQAIIGGITKKIELEKTELTAESRLTQESTSPDDPSKFPALTAVKEELEAIREMLPVKGDYRNEEFNRDRLEQAITSFRSPIVHLATHGLFSSNLEDTFILSWDKEQSEEKESSGNKELSREEEFPLGTRLDINELSRILKGREPIQQRPIELLVLSACQTAAGDDRAALGIAGIAIESGARSTLASLWSVNDEATAELMTYFYQELVKERNQDNKGNKGNKRVTTKAEALRLAQERFLSGKLKPQQEAQQKPNQEQEQDSNQQTEQDPNQEANVDPDIYKHPYYWASFVLVGNWR